MSKYDAINDKSNVRGLGKMDDRLDKRVHNINLKAANTHQKGAARIEADVGGSLKEWY